MISEQKIYDLIKVELIHAPDNKQVRTIFLEILKYCELFDEYNLTSSHIRKMLNLPPCYNPYISIARGIYPLLKKDGYDPTRSKSD